VGCELRIAKRLQRYSGTCFVEGHSGSRNWPPGGDSFGIGRHFHCQILATPCNATCDRIATHAANIANHVATSGTCQYWTPNAFSSSSSSSASALAWRNYSPRRITPPRFYERFCVPLRLGANWGYWPSDSVFDQGGGVRHKLLMFLTWMGSFACHWHWHHGTRNLGFTSHSI
jgi:hypothetical protein